MKNFKRIFAVMLTAVMVFTLGIATCMTASAVDAPKITITPPQDNVAHTYAAYQIFAGDLVDGKLSNITWGEGIDGAAFLTALQADTDLATIFAGASTAANVAEILSNYTDNSNEAFKFAAIADENLTTEFASVDAAANTDCELGVSANGYYLVKDTSANAAAVKTRFLLKVLGEAAITAKAVLPTLEKKIVEGDNEISENAAGIGDKIDFILKSEVPDMTGYTKYFFVINDTLSQGLTYDDSVTPVVKIGNTTLTEDTDYTISTNDAGSGKTNIKIVFKKFIERQADAGKAITVTYSATLNENADLTMNGNDNTATLTYSNDPNADGDPDTDEPVSGDPIGQTPGVSTKTFTTTLKLTKVKKGTSTPLTGAEFQIEGMGSKITLITGIEYVADAEGTYYKLKDGTYTETVPNGSNSDKYESTSHKYTLTTLTKVKKTEDSAIKIKAFVGADGTLTFSGLGEGTYTITELTAPTGYNKLLNPIEVTISAVKESSQIIEFKAEETTVSYDKVSNTLAFNVENSEGTTLPATGGMGTKLFYILGGLMVLGSAIVLVTRKRVAAIEK